MPSFLHSGDLGDIVYAMPAMRDLGGGLLYLVTRHWTKEMTHERFAAIAPLLRAQSYVEDVRWHTGQPVDYDFSTFRKIGIACGSTIANTQARYVGAPPQGSDTQWLHADPAPGLEGRVLIHRSARYHTPFFPWLDIVDFLGSRALFVGPRYDYEPFVTTHQIRGLEHRVSNDLLELARMIAGCQMFIGNQSSPTAVAEGLKHRAVLECHPRSDHCRHIRPGMQHFIRPGDGCYLPDAAGESVLIRARPRYYRTDNPTIPLVIREATTIRTIQWKSHRKWGSPILLGLMKLTRPDEIAAARRARGAIEIPQDQYDTITKEEKWNR